MKKVPITPHISLFGKLGARSRALPMVVTELVDNSLDSWILMPEKYKKGRELLIEITANEKRDSQFIIKDNAGGMTEEALAKAMTVAHSEKDSEKGLLGSFGFGLKSAAMYIGSKFEIFTMHYSEPDSVYFVEFDRKKFEAQGKWEVTIEKMTPSEAAKMLILFPHKHGTEIRIDNEKYRAANKNGIVNRLRKTFAPRLPVPKGVPPIKGNQYDRMILKFNSDELQPSGPFYQKWIKPTAEFLEAQKKRDVYETGKGMQDGEAIMPDAPYIDIPEKRINGKKVWGRAAIMDRGMAYNGHYGLDLIKNGRVIELHAVDKDSADIRVGLVASNHNARITGQIFLDDWTTDHQKTEFIKDSDDWTEVGAYVREKIKKLLGVSSGLQHKGGAKDEKESSNAEDLAHKMHEKALTGIQQKVQKAGKSAAVQKAFKKIETRKQASAKAQDYVKKPLSTSKILSTRVFPETAHLGKNAPIMKTKIVEDRSANTLKVIMNLDHPFLKGRGSEQLNAIHEYLVVDARSAYMLKMKNLMNYEDFVELRDTYLVEMAK